MNNEIRILDRHNLIIKQFWVDKFSLTEVDLIESELKSPVAYYAKVFLKRNYFEIDLNTIKAIKEIKL